MPSAGRLVTPAHASFRGGDVGAPRGRGDRVSGSPLAARSARLLSYLIVLMLVSLCSGVEWRTPAGIVKPFDALMPVAFGLYLASGARRLGALCAPLALFALFLLHQTLSAYATSFDLGVKKSVQAAIILLFCQILWSLDMRRLHAGHAWLGIGGVVLIMAFNVAWHLRHGIYSGWKHLDEPKMTFLLLPGLLAVYQIVRRTEASLVNILAWVALSPLILMSGERKALVAFLGIVLITYLRQRTFHVLVPLAAFVLLLAALGYASGSSYVARQIDSLLRSADPSADVASLAAGYIPTSTSDAARQMSEMVAWQLYAQHPWFGAGVQGILAYFQSHYDRLPVYLVVGVHKEPLRVLAETGLFGLLIYVAALGNALKDACLYSAAFRRVGDGRYLRGIICLLLPLAVYIWSEGSGLEMFIVGALFVFLPVKFAELVAGSARAHRTPRPVPPTG